MIMTCFRCLLYCHVFSNPDTMRNPVNYITASAVAGIIACVGEFATLFILGSYCPGYSQLKDSMSLLGSSASSVSEEISAWWIIMGVLMIFFGTGFKKAFSEKRGYATFAALLIIIYGLGEGIGSGAFKLDHAADRFITPALIHNTLGGIGVVAILLLPCIMIKVITRSEMPSFYRMSQVVFVTGIITILLFLFRYSPDNTGFLMVYKGLWQRLFMLNTYIYLSAIAVIMIKKQKHRQENQ
jgi:hypothetical protein